MAIKIDIRDVSIAHYFPNTVFPSLEFETLAKVVDPELYLLHKELWQAMCNTFVYDINEQGAKRWEEMLGITPPAGASLESRKQAILMLINAQLPYTERTFQAMLDGIYGEGEVKIKIDYDNYHIAFDLGSYASEHYDSLSKYTRIIVPANMGYGVTIERIGHTNLYIGTAICQSGVRSVTIPKLPDVSGAFYIGTVALKQGTKELGLDKLDNSFAPCYVGIAAVKQGIKYFNVIRS